MIEYRVVKMREYDHFRGSFENAINALIAEGWEPIGGIAAYGEPGIWLQAMIKRPPIGYTIVKMG
jgi:hypothetical protein